MNAELQEDELLALSSIFPDTVTSSLTLAGRQVRITVELDWGEDREVQVWDWEEEPTPVASGSQLIQPEDRGAWTQPARRQGTARTGERPPATPTPLSATTAPPRQPRRRRGGKSSTPSSSPPSTQPASPRPKQPIRRADPPPRPLAGILTLSSTPHTPPLLTPLPTPTPPPLPPPPPLKEEKMARKLMLRYLPPLELVVLLKEGYPGEEAPEVELRDGSGWLRPEWVERLQRGLQEVWTGEECLWLMVDMLRGESLIQLLDVQFPLVLSHRTLAPLSPILASHDRLSRSTAFQASNFVCGICLDAKKGLRCIRLSCSDVFCLPCLVSYFTLLITEGLVLSVHCPSVACVQARSEMAKSGIAGPRIGEVGREELDGIVGVELGERWERLKEKMRVESDPSMSFCPREACQAAVPKAVDDEKLRICGSCGYSYCVFCRRGWHGTRNPCSLPQSSAIVSRFLSGTPAEQAALELRYGVANIRRLVAVVEEERVNREWMEEHATPCPVCAVQVEKSVGCNHMQCSRCSTHFCFRCGEKLRPTEPYIHFSAIGTPCYNKLFDFAPGQEPAMADWIADIVGEDA